MAMTLKPLMQFGLQQVMVTTMQALSGAGYPGVPSLDIIDNVIPYIGGEEPQLETEPRKMLGRLAEDHIELLDCVASATGTRVPVLDGHLVSVGVRFAEPVTEAQI